MREVVSPSGLLAEGAIRRRAGGSQTSGPAYRAAVAHGPQRPLRGELANHLVTGDSGSWVGRGLTVCRERRALPLTGASLAPRPRQPRIRLFSGRFRRSSSLPSTPGVFPRVTVGCIPMCHGGTKGGQGEALAESPPPFADALRSAARSAPSTGAVTPTMTLRARPHRRCATSDRLSASRAVPGSRSVQTAVAGADRAE